MNYIYSVDDFFTKFPKGTIVVSEFDVRRCIFAVESPATVSDNQLYGVNATFGLDAANNLHKNHTFGVKGNRVRLASDGEKCQLLKAMLEEQVKEIKADKTTIQATYSATTIIEDIENLLNKMGKLVNEFGACVEDLNAIKGRIG